MNRFEGLLHWAFPAMLALAAVTILLSGRDLSQQYAELATVTEFARHPAIAWLQRLVSLFLVIAAGERILSHFISRKHIPSPMLAGSYVIFWLATVGSPAVFGAHPQLAHDYLYALIVGVAVAMATGEEGHRILTMTRTALFVFLLIGLALIPVAPSLVLDSSYTQGLLPGVPRLGGVAPHPVALGMVALVFVLVLWAKPFSRKGLNFLAWTTGLASLFLAQSKTAWMAFILCSAAMFMVRHSGNAWRRIGDPTRGEFGILACIGVMAGVLVVMGAILLGDIEGRALDFLDSPEGAQLATLTGRDRIWAVAAEEWAQNPVFGYGVGIWDAAFRASIDMPNAVNAHNQFMDALSRSGVVGAAGLLLYAAVLMVLSARYAKATGGLSLALFLALALRCVSEVPLLLLGYGIELVEHLLLIVTLASAAAAPRPVALQTGPAVYKVAS
jgi:O-antigen ligase